MLILLNHYGRVCLEEEVVQTLLFDHPRLTIVLGTHEGMRVPLAWEGMLGTLSRVIWQNGASAIHERIYTGCP